MEERREVRLGLVRVMLERYPGREDAQRFAEQWGDVLQPDSAPRGAAGAGAAAGSAGQGPVTLDGWAARMVLDGTPGDAAVLDAFAYHYRRNIRLYSPAAPAGPLAFPSARAMGGSYPGAGCFQLLHASWRGGGQCFVPVWPASVGFTPRLEEVRVA